jgi:low affinity Fe/Cu permease
VSFSNLFTRFARWTARVTGRPVTFLIAVVIIVVWAITGPIFHFSDTWQLVINTGTTIVTFLMVFLIQNTQYRDSEAIHIKLDELIRAVAGAHNILTDLEESTETDLEKIHASYQALARNAKLAAMLGIKDTDSPDVAIMPEDGGAEDNSAPGTQYQGVV